MHGPAVAWANVTADWMAEVDRVATEVHGIGIDQMVEHAGRALVSGVTRLLGGPVSLAGVRVLVLAGPGHNGAGGLAAVRRLVTAEAEVGVVLTRMEDELSEAAQTHATIARSLEVPVWPGAGMGLSAAFAGSGMWDVVIDALLGYSQRGVPHGMVRDLLEALEAVDAQVLSLDVPTGMHPTTGRTGAVRARAHATVTLGVPKIGMFGVDGRHACGQLWVATLGLPEIVWRTAGIVGELPPFEVDGLWALPEDAEPADQPEWVEPPEDEAASGGSAPA